MTCQAPPLHTPGFVCVAVVSDDVPLVASRQLLQQFATSLPALQPEVHKEVAHHALTKIQPRVVSFEDQVSLHASSSRHQCGWAPSYSPTQGACLA